MLYNLQKETAVLPDLGIRDIVRVCDICYKFIIINRMKSNGLLTNEELYVLDNDKNDKKERNNNKKRRRHNTENMINGMMNDEDNNDDDEYYGINKEWRKFIAHHYCDKLDPFDDELKELIRNGIPSIIRGYIWRNMVSFKNLERFEDGDDDFMNEIKDNDSNEEEQEEEDIYLTMEKDLQRTFPIHKIYKNEESINSLRIILKRYSVRNKEIGYCQSMNFLGGILLLFLNENDSFWMLSYLIEKICCLFDEYFYHQKDILGVKIDGFVFNDIIKEYLPNLYQHLINIDGTDNKNNKNFNVINNLTFHWFLSLFINTLSFKSLLKIWDNMICYDNINIIFRAALTILKIKSGEILKCSEFFQIHDILSNKNILNDKKIQKYTQNFIKICLNNSEFKDIDNFILKQRIYHRNKLDDDYIGSQIYNDIEINLISEYADYNRGTESFIHKAKTTLTGDESSYCFDDTQPINYNDDDEMPPNSWILYNSHKSSLPVSVKKYTFDTPRRSLSNIQSNNNNLDIPYNKQNNKQKQNKKSKKNLNNTNKYYFQSDDNDSIDNMNNNNNDNDNKNNQYHYDLFKSSPSITRATKNSDKTRRSKSEAFYDDDDNDSDMITHNNGTNNNSPRFESQLLISKSYHHKNNNNRKAWSLDDDVLRNDLVLVASPTQKTLFDDYIHIANTNNS